MRFAAALTLLAVAATRPAAAPGRVAAGDFPAGTGAAAAPARAASPRACALFADTLDCGLAVGVLEDHAAPTVSIQTWVRAGTSGERPGLQGAAHLLEHLQFARPGQERYEAHEQRLTALGADFDGETGRDAAIFTTNVPAAAWREALSIELARLQPAFPSDPVFRRERGVLVVESRRVAGRLDTVTGRALLEALFPSHPYGTPAWSPDLDAERLSAAEVGEFFARWYRPSRTALLVVGDLDGRACLEAIRAIADSTWAAGSPEARIRLPLPAPRGGDIRLHRTGSLSQVLVAFSVPGSPDSSDAVWPLVVDLLAGGHAGLLDLALTDSLKLAADCGGRWEPGELAGMVALTVTLRPEADPDEARAEAAAAIDALLRGPLPVSRIKRSAARLAALDLLGAATHEGQGAALGRTWLAGGDWTASGRPGVTLTFLLEALRRYAGPERRVWLTVEGEPAWPGEENR